MRIDGVFLFIGVGAVAGTELIKIGVAGRAHGVRGAVRVFMDDEGSDSLLHVREVYLGPEHRRYDVRRAVRCGRFMALELEDITDRDAASALTGQEVRVLRKSLRPLRHAYYASDLVGSVLVDETGRTWGTVERVMPNGPQDLLEYRREDGTKGYVPFVSAHVGKVDLEGGTIAVDGAWMSELDAVFGG